MTKMTQKQLELKRCFEAFVEQMNGEDTSELSQNELLEMMGMLKNKLQKVRQEEEEEKERLKEEEERRKAEEKQKAHDQHVEAVTCMDLPMDWDNLFETDSRSNGVHFDRVSDALIKSLTTLGKVDIEYIAAITDKEYKEVIKELKGSVYQNPATWNECFYKGWETAEEYLSGNLMQKWKRAKEADSYYNGYFSDNLKALEQAMPEGVSGDEIYVTLGSPWVPAHIIDEFIEYLIGPCISLLHDDKLKDLYRVRHDEITGTWEVPYKDRYKYGVYATTAQVTYGTNKIGALTIIEKTLNMKQLEIRKPTNSILHPNATVVDKDETVLIIDKQKKIIQEFQRWIWKKPKRKKELEDIYSARYGCVRVRRFDGSFLEFPTMSKETTLYPYQKDAVARILFSPNTLLAHDVGSGKTYIMIAAAMEKRRMGLSDKNLFVVPNNLVKQWQDIFYRLYPDAKLLMVTPNKFNPQKREAVMEDIRDNDYDGIIMAYSCFEMIPLSKDYYIKELEKQKEAIFQIVQTKSKATRKLKKKQEKLQEALYKLEATLDDMYDGIYFDELGITSLFVDEAHNYKNVPIDTKINKVLGINKRGSAKCKDMMDKVHCVQRQNDGGGVVLATGTPVTNSITDVYVMQQYLQSGELALVDLQNFDSWAGMFAEQKTRFEIDVDTTEFRMVTRFARFHNLPELTTLFASVADFHSMADNPLLPAFDGYTDCTVKKTPAFDYYLKTISNRVDDVRMWLVDKKEDNMLKITTDGRKAALDLRLVDDNATFDAESKVVRCAEEVFELYHKYYLDGKTQLVFCDISVPKSSFNIYDELRRLLEQMGVKHHHIAYVHEAESERKRKALFEGVKKGEIRILIGSTFKLGMGVNVQDNLIAVHHLDVPWRPADMIQREGRILREGNTNDKIFIYRYITEGSFDAYSWQLLETKQRFISELLSGCLKDRSGDDVNDTVLDYAEVKALAIGNPLIKEKVEVENSLNRYLTLQNKQIRVRMELERSLVEIAKEREKLKDRLMHIYQDMVFVNSSNYEYSKDERVEIRSILHEAVVNQKTGEREKELMSYRGFRIIIPTRLFDDKVYVVLEGSGRYKIDMGDKETGNLIRIDNFINTLEDKYKAVQKRINQLGDKETGIITELKNKVSYATEIEDLRSKLEKINKKLGVEQNAGN